MKSRGRIFKWLALAVALAMLLGPNLVFRSASAQGEPTPTPTEIVPEPNPSPTGESTSGGEPTFQTLAVSAPTPADPDCSDGECVFRVTASADDAGTNPSCTYRTYWNEIYLGECTSGQGITSGFRFANVNLPAGAQIAEAYLEFTVDGPYTDELTVMFYGQASGNAQPFSSASRPDNRPLTQASVQWHILASDRWELGQIRTSPDLTAIVQEIVDRSDWASGNALAIIVKNAAPASGQWRHRRVIGYDRPVWYPGRENAARLVVRLTQQVSITITDTQENPVTALNLNANGWTTPNPLFVKVTFTCPAGPWNCDYYPFSLNIQAAEGRFYLYEASLPPAATNCYGDYPAAQTTYNTFTLSCSSYSLLAGDTVSHTWKLWIQPSGATALNVEATYGAESDTAALSIPQASIYPVVVIPGFLGSWKNFSGEWVIDPLLGTYNILLEELRRAGYEDSVSLFTFPYDWRQHVADNGSALGSGIDSFLQQADTRPYVRTDKVDIISHSMGGLVSRAYIQGNSYDNNVRRLITLGTPHLGAPSSYLMAEGLEFQGAEGPILRAVAQFLARKSGYCTWVYPPPWSEAAPTCIVTNSDLYQYVAQRIPSAREIFPDRRYLASDPGGYLISAADLAQVYPYEVQVNDFLESLNSNAGTLVSRLGAQGIIPIVGNSTETVTDSYYRVVQRQANEIPLWVNGKVPQNLANEEFRKPGLGDGTVPSTSADLGLVDSRITSLVVTKADDSQQDVVHRNLPTQLQLTSIERLIGLHPPFDAGFSDPLVRNPILIRNLSPVEMQVIDPLGRRAGVDFETWSELAEIPDAAFWRSDVPGEPDFLFIREPLSGTYTIRLLGIAEGPYTVGMESLNAQGSLTVGEFFGQSIPGAHYEHQITYDPAALPPLPLSLTWLPPLREDETLSVQLNRTLPIKFSLRDAQGNFVVDESVIVWVVDVSSPGSMVAAFTTQGSNRGLSDKVRIDRSAEQYLVNLHLREYGLQAGRAYVVGITAFGRQVGSAAFVVRP